MVFLQTSVKLSSSLLCTLIHQRSLTPDPPALCMISFQQLHKCRSKVFEEAAGKVLYGIRAPLFRSLRVESLFDLFQVS